MRFQRSPFWRSPPMCSGDVDISKLEISASRAMGCAGSRDCRHGAEMGTAAATRRILPIRYCLGVLMSFSCTPPSRGYTQPTRALGTPLSADSSGWRAVHPSGWEARLMSLAFATIRPWPTRHPTGTAGT